MANLGRVTGVVEVVPLTASADTPVELSAHDRKVMDSDSTVEVEAHDENVEANELTHR